MEIANKFNNGDKVFVYHDPMNMINKDELSVFEGTVCQIKVHNCSLHAEDEQKGEEPKLWLTYGVEIDNDEFLGKRTNFDVFTCSEQNMFKTLEEAIEHAKAKIWETIVKREETNAKLYKSFDKLKQVETKIKKTVNI